MAEIINLNRVRKAKRRSQAETLAAANRATFGRTKAEKHAEALEKARAERAVDGAKLSD